MAETQKFRHKLPFTSEEVLLLAGLSLGVLGEADLRAAVLAAGSSNTLSPAHLDYLVERLQTFVSAAVARDELLRGKTAINQTVGTILFHSELPGDREFFDDEVSDAEYSLQS